MNSAVLYREETVSMQEKEWSEPRKLYSPPNPNTPILADRSVSRLRRLYEFRGGLALERFLRDNDFLITLLLDAPEEIRKHFDSGTRVALEIVEDPEARGDQQLFVVVRTKFPPKVARALLAQLDQNWWLDVLPAARGKMEIATERV